jgi:hypothetical protein
MISNELMEKYQVLKVWKCLKKVETNVCGYTCGYLCECEDGKWLAVITDASWDEVKVLVLNTRVTASKRLRKRGFFTRMFRIYP